MGSFPSSEADREFDLGALAYALLDFTSRGVKVMGPNIGSEAHLLLLGAFLALLGFAFFLRRQIKELAIVQEPADRGFGIWSHLNQVDFGVTRQLERAGDVHHTELCPVVSYYSDLGAVNPLVDPILSSYALVPPIKSSPFA